MSRGAVMKHPRRRSRASRRSSRRLEACELIFVQRGRETERTRKLTWVRKPWGDALSESAMRGGASGSRTSPRLYWVDFAKALAIILVVVYHSASSMDLLFPNPSGPASAFWAEFNNVALPLRMPLFFIAAGVLAYSATARSWSSVFRPRVIVLLWPYVLWTIAFACVGAFAYQPENPISYAVTRVQGLPFGRLGYWFLLVLAVFFVVAKLLRRWAVVVLAVALVFAVAGPWLEVHVFPSMHWLIIYGVTKVTRYAFWYLLGCYAFPYVIRFARINPVWLMVVGGSAFAALTWLAESVGPIVPLGFMLSVAGVAAMIGLSVCVSSFQRTRSVSRYLAERTMPIYLIHPMLIVLVIIAARLFGGADHPDDVMATVLAPVLATLLVVASVLIFNWLRNSRAQWVFAPPTWLGRVSRPA